MERHLNKFAPIAFTLLRIVSGLMFACHGAQKILRMFHPSYVPPLVSFGGTAGWIELIGGFMIALGLFGGYAAFICSGEMAVGYFLIHAPQGFFPILNKGELCVMYCFVFLYTACHGSGPISIDRWLKRFEFGRKDRSSKRPKSGWKRA